MDGEEYVEACSPEKGFVCEQSSDRFVNGKFDRNSGFILIPVYFQQSDGSYGPYPEESSSYALPAAPYCTEPVVVEGTFDGPPEVAIATSTPKKRYRCDVCEGSFTKLDNLKRHVEDVHKTPAHVRYVCPHCFVHIKRKDNLAQHQQRGCRADLSTIPRRYPCPVCGKTFSSMACVRRHAAIAHRPPEDRPTHSCSQCSYETPYTQQLRSHTLLIHGIGEEKRVHVCDICEVDCGSRYALKKHEAEGRCGVGEKGCVECRMEFRTWSKLRKHRAAVHGGIAVLRSSSGGELGKRGTSQEGRRGSGLSDSVTVEPEECLPTEQLLQLISSLSSEQEEGLKTRDISQQEGAEYI